MRLKYCGTFRTFISEFVGYIEIKAVIRTDIT